MAEAPGSLRPLLWRGGDGGAASPAPPNSLPPAEGCSGLNLQMGRHDRELPAAGGLRGSPGEEHESP